MAALRSFLCLLLTFVSITTPAHGQYVQAAPKQYIRNSAGSWVQMPMWRETTATGFTAVIDIAPELVVLEYNCYYMRDICKNADNWFNTPRGQSRVPRYRFAYDFNTGKTSAFRNNRRRSASCGNFKNRVTCPHSDQGIVMRQDGPWRYKSLEPGTTINEIRADVWANGARRPSEVRYTCDEFPPATWIEGGSGFTAPEASAEEAQTRCAAFRCGGTRGIKAEQNWQATAHNALQSSLKAIIRRRNRASNPQEFAWYRAKDSVTFFEFRYSMSSTNANGVAAKVYTYSSSGQSPPAVTKNIQQAKRDLIMELNGTTTEMDDEELDREAFWRWADGVSVEDLLALGPRHVKEEHVLANHTEAAILMPDGVEMPWWGSMNDGEDEDEDGDEAPPLPEVVSGPPRADPNKIKRALATENPHSSSSSPDLTPALLKNASTTDVERAREIIEDAILKSAKLNAARLANPARNRYRLQPGTVIGGRKIDRRIDRRAHDEVADSDEAPPPLLDITDEIAQAAALVSEADAVAGNLTSRAPIKAAASGTFWMEHISRMGTVPFGDDPSYQVFRNVVDFGAVGDGVTVSRPPLSTHSSFSSPAENPS